MNSRNIILEELRSLNSGLLIKDLQEPVFSLPENYFEYLADEILKKVKSQEISSVTDELKGLSPLLAGIPRINPYSVPEGYFSNIGNDITSAVSVDEMPPVLKYIGKDLPYDVPEGYFDNLPGDILRKLRKKPAKVISFTRNRVFKMAAAAMVAGILMISGFMYFNRDQVDPVNNPESWVAKKLQGVSNQELQDFIETADISTDDKTASNPNEVKEMLGDVSVKEIDAFLAQIPTDDDELMVIN